jgi:uncharacterized membrane protein YdjX (TVP38/TMEM64 family)
MGRIVEVLVALNALGGIAAFLGFRYAGRKVRDKVIGRKEAHEDEPSEPGSTIQGS